MEKIIDKVITDEMLTAVVVGTVVAMTTAIVFIGYVTLTTL